mgnify:CR=1 FL=1
MNEELKNAVSEGEATMTGNAATPAMLGDVTAETVTIGQGGAQNVKAREVHVNQGGIARAEGKFIDVQDGGVALALGENMTLTDGGVAVVMAENVKMVDSMALFVGAGHVDGENTKIIFDMRAAVLCGVLMGIVASLFSKFCGRKA